MRIKEDIRIGLLGLPVDNNSSFARGAAAAPPLIREALFNPSSNSYSETGISVDEQLLEDFGDLADEPDPHFPERIQIALGQILARDCYPICLGGDHSISWPIIEILATRYPELTLVHFDAHTDLYHDFEGNPFSHASPFARIMERFPHFRLIQIGIRTHNPHTRTQAQRFGVEVVEMRNFDPALIIESVNPIYISFDLDGLDPAFAPGVSHQEPGGLTTRQAIDIIHRIQGRIIGADVVEFNPRFDTGRMTAMVAGRLVKEIAAKIVLSNREF